MCFETRKLQAGWLDYVFMCQNPSKKKKAETSPQLMIIKPASQLRSYAFISLPPHKTEVAPSIEGNILT